MKIIKPGYIYNKIYTTECSECHCIFEFAEDEIRKQSPDWPNLRIADYVKYPTCGNCALSGKKKEI